MKTRIAAFAMIALFSVAFTARAETTLTLEGVHICCGACVKAIGKTLGDVDGATGKCDRKARTVTIVAADDATAQKALDALSKAGFHGKTGNKKLAIKDDSGAGKEKVSRLELTGTHNCCGGCCKTIKKILLDVSGVDATNIKPRAKSYVVEGNFVPADLVKALNGAGFHAKVKK